MLHISRLLARIHIRSSGSRATSMPMLLQRSQRRVSLQASHGDTCNAAYTVRIRCSLAKKGISIAQASMRGRHLNGRGGNTGRETQQEEPAFLTILKDVHIDNTNKS
eukprot:5081010-Amphidinium_carterae.1